MSDLFKVFLSILVALSIGLGLGYYMAPDKVVIQEKIVEKEVTKKEEYKKKTKKYDPDTGKIIEDTEETGTKESNSNSTKTDKTEEKSIDKKYYAIKAGVVVPVTKLDNPTYRVGGELRLPLFNSWVGSEVDIKMNPNVGLYLRMEF